MWELLGLIALIAGWVFISRYIFPKVGIPV